MRTALTVVLIGTAATLCGCQVIERMYSTEADGPQSVLVLNAGTRAPVPGARVDYDYRCLGPRATLRRAKGGHVVVEPQLRIPDIDQPLTKPLPGDNLDEVWNQYNDPRDRGPVINGDGSWNTSSFRTRTISRSVYTNAAGRAPLPIIHAPVRFRQCRVTIIKPGYRREDRTVGIVELDALSEKGRTIRVFLSPLH